MRAQSVGFGELNVEYGYCYQSAAIVPTAAFPSPCLGCLYPPRAGTIAPGRLVESGEVSGDTPGPF